MLDYNYNYGPMPIIMYKSLMYLNQAPWQGECGAIWNSTPVDWTRYFGARSRWAL